MIVRVRFGKEGTLRYIGHLDVLRTFQKIFRRAGVPMGYSQGFSPHPVMSFALPLGLGLTSEGEYLDAEVAEGYDTSLLVRALQNATAAELPVYSARILPENAGNAMASVGRARYLAPIPADLPKEALQRACEALLAKTSLVITKQTKTRETEQDIRPVLYLLELRQEGLFMEIGAGSNDNVKPETVLELLLREMGRETSGQIWALRRLDLLDRQGQSLGSIGEEL